MKLLLHATVADEIKRGFTLKSTMRFSYIIIILSWPFLTLLAQQEWAQYTNNSDIRQIAIRGDELWAATNGGPVSYNLKTNQKRIYTRLDGLIGLQVLGIAVNPTNGTIWCVNFNWRPDAPGYKYFALFELQGERWVEVTIIPQTYGQIAYDSLGNLWLPSHPSGSVYKNGEITQLDLPFSPTTLAIDTLNRVWFGSWNSGVALYDNGAITTYTTVNSGISSNEIRSIAIDRFNRIWFAHPTAGISCFDGQNWVSYTSTNSTLPSDKVRSVFANEISNIWAVCNVNCGSVLAKFDGNSWDVIQTFQNPGFGLQVATDQDRNLYFSSGDDSSESDSIHFHDSWGTILKYNSNAGWTKLSIGQNTIAYPPIQSIVQDKKGNLWFGHMAYGLVKFDYNTWIHYKPTLATMVPSAFVTSIAVDSNDVLWAVASSVSVSSSCGGGFFRGGVVSYDGSQWKVFTTQNSTLPSDDLTSIAVDENNYLWIGTVDQGVIKFDGQSWFTYDTSNSDLLNNNVGKVVTSKGGRIWFATGSGLCSFDGTNWRVEPISLVTRWRIS